MIGYLLKRLLVLAVVIAGVYFAVRYSPMLQEWIHSDVAVQEDDDAVLEEGTESYRELPSSDVPFVHAVMPKMALPSGIAKMLEKDEVRLTSGRVVVYTFPDQIEEGTTEEEWVLDDHGPQCCVRRTGEGLYEIAVADGEGNKVRVLNLRARDGVWEGTQDAEGREVGLLIPNNGGENEAREALLMPQVEIALPTTGKGLAVSRTQMEAIGRITPNMLSSEEYKLKLNTEKKSALAGLESSLRGEAVWTIPNGLKMPNVARNHDIMINVSSLLPPPFTCQMEPFATTENTLVGFNVRLSDRFDFFETVTTKLLAYANAPHAPAMNGIPAKAFSIAHVYYLLSSIPQQASQPEEQRKTATRYASLFLNSAWKEFCEKNMAHLPMPDEESITLKNGKAEVFAGTLRQLIRFSGRSTQDYLCSVLSNAARDFFLSDFKEHTSVRRPAFKLRLNSVKISSDDRATWFFVILPAIARISDAS